jgi:endoglucanase
VEFAVDGSKGTADTWLNGQQIAGLHADGTKTTNVDGQWYSKTWRPKVSDLRLGWESYAGGADTLWFDDVVVSSSRIGCGDTPAPSGTSASATSSSPSPASASPASSGSPTSGGAPSGPIGKGTGTGFLHTSGSKIVDSTGKVVQLTGLNWFGGETSNQTFHGLWSVGYKATIDKIVGLGYNTLRVPYSDDIFKPGAAATSINEQANPDLKGLTPLQVFDKVIAYAGSKGMRVILDRHRPDSGSQSALWYTSAVPESTWIANWKTLATHYKGNTTVIGADLHNEPHNDKSTTSGSCWGCGDEKRDWRLAAERAGNAILSVNPDWLIIVEGVDSTTEQPAGWWGGNLTHADNYPVRLSKSDKLVYSAHEYANSVFHQTWFDDAAFPNNLPAIWDRQWGFLVKKNVAPVLLGEFGSTLTDPQDVQWLKKLMQYVDANGISFTYWSLNPNSGDTGGILNDDWTTINQTKQSILQPSLKGVGSGA